MKNMDICRLCLQPGAQVIQNYKQILSTLNNFLPYMNCCLKLVNIQLCDICLENIQALLNINATLNITNTKISAEIEKSKLDKINLKKLISNGTLNKWVSVCRICLKIVQDPQIFLYDNEFNILRHDLIFKMFKFCKMSLNCDLSENPIMCLQCWQNLQICYSFRKCYLETDKKIRAYFTFYHIKAKNVTVQVVEEMGKYFLEHDDIFNLQKVVKEEIFCDNIDSNRYSLRKRVKKEYLDNIVKCDEFEDKPIKKENSGALFQKRPKRHLFTNEEVEFLLNTYLNITNNDTCAALNPWKKIQVEWDKNFSSKLTCDTISRKLKRVLANKTKVQLTKTTPQRNSMANKQKRIKNSSILPSRRQSSDSDDSFVDEVIPSSFAPIIKPEPLSDTEEYHIINQKMDLPPSDSETDNESLPIPELERMDVPQMNYQIERIPHMNFGIQDISSVDVKRESINMFSTSGELNPNVVIENLTTTKRITFKNQNNETIYKCMQCNFETKYKYSADRHYNRHANSMSKGFECIHCSFVTSKYFLLKHHLSTNHEDNSINYGCNDELPVLMPYTI